MRKLIDKNGIEVWPESVNGSDAYAGMLEGSPYMARKFRLLMGRSQMQTRGHYVHGLDELEREIAGMSRDFDIWAPNERWTAKMVEAFRDLSRQRNFVWVTWYQSGGDPMQQLADIVAGLDIRQYCQQEVVDELE